MLFSLILFLAVFLPFQVALNPTVGVDLASVRVFILIIFLLWLAKGLKDKKVVVPNNFQTNCIWVFLFLSFLSVFFARNAGWGIRKLVFFLSIFPIYFVVADIVKRQVDLKRMVKLLVVSGTIAATVGLLQFIAQFFVGINALYTFWSKYVAVIFLGQVFSQSVLEHPSWLVDISGHTYFRVISVFPDPHMLALFLGLLFPLAVALFFEHRKKGWLICSGIIFLADIFTFSRGGYLGLLAGFLALFFFFQGSLVKKYKIAFFSGLIFLSLTLFIPNPISARFFSSFDLQEGSNAGRFLMWQKASENIVAHPFMGLGLGNFPLAVSPLATYREPIYAHNTYLDIAVESGLLAAISFLGILFFSIKALLKKARKDKLYLGAAISLLIFSGHSLVETGIYSPVVLTLLLIIIAFSNIKEGNAKIY